jgi:uroporphyrinogen decarboxylase
MEQMTGKERITRIIQHKPVDRIGLYEHFWGDTLKRWQEQGHVKQDENLADHFGFDMENAWVFKMAGIVDSRC